MNQLHVPDKVTSKRRLLPSRPPRQYIANRATDGAGIGRLRWWLVRIMNGQIKRNNLVRIEHSERLMPVRMAYREQQPHRRIRPLELARLWPRQRHRKSAHRLLARRVGRERAGGVHKKHGEARLGLGHVCLRC